MVEKAKVPMSWKPRKQFWNTLLTRKFAGNKPTTIPVPIDNKRKIRAVPLDSVYGDIPISDILVADHIPSDEISRPKKLFVKYQIKMSSLYPAMQAGLPPIDEDADAALEESYTKAHRKQLRAPELPSELEISDVSELLGSIAVKGPFAGYLEKDDGVLRWDLRDLDKYEHRPGLRGLGVRVLFDVDDQTRSLRAYQIESALGVNKPGDAEWPIAAKLALCALSNHTSLVRHWNWLHLACGGPFAIATRNQLSSDHPLRRILWPHMFGTQYSNDIGMEVQMNSSGDFPNIFSFTFRGMCHLFSETYREYRVSQINPPMDAEQRGIRDGGFDTPTQDNLEELFSVIRAHTDGYVRAYYRDDAKIRDDEDLRHWLDELEQLIPNGIGELVSEPLTRDSVSNITASFIYLGCVHHEVMGTNLWNYQLWTHKIPVRVYENGQREPLDVYQRLVNANFNLNVSRAKLMQDFSYLALDAEGEILFERFLKELEALNADMTSRPPAHWRICPHVLEANTNA